MWKTLNHQVQGTSHVKSGTPCQDYTYQNVFQTDSDEVLVVLVSDGAGSAKHSETGSRLTCQTVMSDLDQRFAKGLKVEELTKEMVVEIILEAQLRLKEKADSLETALRDFACTILGAVIGKKDAVFFQIGDGVLVTWGGEQYRYVFWPDNGEYANTTFFVTEPTLESTLQFQRSSERIDEVAAMSDGLQMLALDYKAKAAHGPFFSTLFTWLRQAADGEEVDRLIGPFQQFLNSPAVNQRTDDDKSLVLATRITTKKNDQPAN